MAIAWWLVPNALSARLLRNVINKTAAHHNSPTFPPHVELFSLNTDKTIEEFVEITQPVVDEARAPISLQQAGVRVGDTFHRSVYLALVPSIELTTLRSNLLNALGVPADMERPVFPHLALYYGEGSKDGKYDVVYQMMESCTVDIMKNGMIEVAGLESLGLTEMWIVDIRTEDPAGWMVLHKQALIGSELAIPSIPAPPSPVTQTNETTAGADDIVIDYISYGTVTRSLATLSQTISNLYWRKPTSLPASSAPLNDLLVAIPRSPMVASAVPKPELTITDYLKEMKRLEGDKLHKKLAQVVANQELRSQATSLKGNDAVKLCDLIHRCMTTCPLAGPSMHHAGMLRLLQDICTASGELPSKYWLRGISVNWREYVARGGEATIFRGTMGGRNVVVREVSKPGEHDWTSPEGERVIKFIKREIIVHFQLQHPNIIPLLGIYRERSGNPPMMVMPLMKNGSALAFLLGDGCEDIDCARILIGTAIALKYLHSRSPVVIHGDVHSSNILVAKLFCVISAYPAYDAKLHARSPAIEKVVDFGI